MTAPGEYHGLTPKQAKLLAFLRHQQAEGRTPSYREMAAAMDIVSPGGIKRLIDGLVERGYAGFIANRARSIEVFEHRRVGALQRASTPALIAELRRRGVRTVA